MKKNRHNFNDAGFSLIELIVTILITAILMLAVTMFISTSRSAYQTVNTSATLQEEAMTAERVFSEALMEAKAYGFSENVSLVSGITTDVLWISAKENDHNTGLVNPPDPVYCFLIDRTENQIRYYKESDESKASAVVTAGSLTTDVKNDITSACFGTNAKYSLVCKNVKSVDIDVVPRADGTDLVCMEIVFEYLGKEYTENLTVVTRNLTHAVTTPSSDPTPTGTDDTP